MPDKCTLPSCPLIDGSEGLTLPKSFKKHAPASAAGAGTVVAVILVLSSMGVISFGNPSNSASDSVAATERAAIAKELDMLAVKVEALSGKIDTVNLALTSHIAGVTPLLSQYNADIAEVRNDIRKILGKL